MLPNITPGMFDSIAFNFLTWGQLFSGNFPQTAHCTLLRLWPISPDRTQPGLLSLTLTSRTGIKPMCTNVCSLKMSLKYFYIMFLTHKYEQIMHPAWCCYVPQFGSEASPFAFKPSDNDCSQTFNFSFITTTYMSTKGKSLPLSIFGNYNWLSMLLLE